MADGPLLVFGPRSLAYDFGPSHPLSPRRFGPGIDLLRRSGPSRGWRPSRRATTSSNGCIRPTTWLRSGASRPIRPDRRRPASGRATIRPSPECTRQRRRLPAGRSGRWRRSCAATSSTPTTPAAGCTMPCGARASGFCIYNDVALAIARARRDGLRVLYVDLDVHHGDGVQALHAGDPGVLTISFHETGRSLFPGTGFVDELGEGRAAGTCVNVPLEPIVRTGCLAGGSARRRARAGCGVRAGRDRQPARRRRPRLGSAGAPLPDDDGDGRGGPAGRSAGASIRRRTVARDRRRGICHLPRRAAGVGADVAGGCAPRGAAAAPAKSGGRGGRAKPRAGATVRCRSASRTSPAFRPNDRSARRRPPLPSGRSGWSEC